MSQSTSSQRSASEKEVFWKSGLFRKVVFLEILGTVEKLEILENRQTVENKGESDHSLEILEILEILGIPPVKRPLLTEHVRTLGSMTLAVALDEKTLFVMSPLSVPEESLSSLEA